MAGDEHLFYGLSHEDTQMQDVDFYPQTQPWMMPLKDADDDILMDSTTQGYAFVPPGVESMDTDGLTWGSVGGQYPLFGQASLQKDDHMDWDV